MTDRSTPWDAVLWDLDGTLADTIPLILHCYGEMMRIHRGEEGDPDGWRGTIGRPLRESLAEIASDPAEAEALHDTYLEIQEEAHDRMVRVFEGIPEVVRLNLDLGLPLAIVTSKGRPMTTRSIRVCRLQGLFPVVVTEHDVTRAKPHPEPVHLALEQLRVPASERVLFIGDSLHDLHAGRAAGISTAGVSWGALSREILETGEPHFLADHPHELCPILEGGPEERQVA